MIDSNQVSNTLNTKLTDLISHDDVRALPSNVAVFAHVGTGGGKSYFCMNTLYDATAASQSRILYLINRKNAYLQFRYLLRQSRHGDRITILTYQTIEKIYTSGGKFDFSKYDYIVCDEYHRFSTDALVDKYSDLVLEHLFDFPSKRFFLSATPSGVDTYIKDILAKQDIPSIEYTLPSSYVMADLQTFKDTAHIEYILKEIGTDSKVAVCFSSVKAAYQYHKQFSDSLFVCSDSNQRYSKYLDIEEKTKMVVEECFDQQYLFCTTCLDAGFNLHDDDLRYMITDIDDPDQILQWIGRKRIHSVDDPLHIYIKDISYADMISSIESWERKLERANYLLEYGQDAYAAHYGMNRDLHTSKDLIYLDADEDNKSINLRVLEMPYQYYKHRIWRYQDILDSGLGYKAYMHRLIGCKDTAIDVWTSKRQFRYQYLESQVGRDIFVNKRKEFYDTLGYIDKNRHRIKNINDLNKYIARDGLPFKINCHRGDYPNGRRHITWWTVEQIS